MNQTDENQADRFMKTRPIFDLLMSMSAPMIISTLVQSLYSIMDSIYVSGLGTQALTAVSLAFPLQNISTSMAIGMGIGITSAIFIHLGSGSAKKTNRSATIGAALAAVHCLVFVVFELLATRPFLMLFIEGEQTLTWACQYTYIVVCISFGCQLQFAIKKIFQAVGSMKVTMTLLTAGCIIGIILDPILILGLLRFPALGIIGTAVATIIGQTTAFLLYIVIYHRKRKTFPVKIHPQYLHFDKAIIHQIYFVGIPSTIMLVLPSVLTSILNSLLARFSDVYVAVLGVYLKLQTFIYMPASGIVQDMHPIIGYNYGAGEYDRVKKVIRYSLFSVAVTMVVGTVAALGFSAQMFAMFDAGGALLDAGISALWIVSLGFVISTVGVICPGAFEALGRGKDSLIVPLPRRFVIAIPLSFLLLDIMRAGGVWLVSPISELCASVVVWILFRRVSSLG